MRVSCRRTTQKWSYVRDRGRSRRRFPVSRACRFPTKGTVHVGGDDYRAVTLGFPGFGGGPVDVTVLSNLSATNASLRSSRAVAVGFIIGFLVLALAFAVVASRALQAQLGGFLQAARRLAAGDFSSPIETQGHDEFAALGEEFNNMSTQLAHRLDELSQERARLRESISRIGQTFASNLDRHALLELALKTAVDAVQGSCGRLSIRPAESEPLVETAREGSFEGLAVAISAAEREVELEGAGVCQREFGDDTTDHVSVLAASLGAADPERTCAWSAHSRTPGPALLRRRPRVGALARQLRRRLPSRTSSCTCKSAARRSPTSSPGSPTMGASRRCWGPRWSRSAAISTR